MNTTLRLNKKFFLLSYFLLAGIGMASAQQLLKNGNFNSTSTNWTTACTSIEAAYTETTYGGTVSTNRVAEVDDESCFYQSVCILPGCDYTFDMKASRRTSNGAGPNPTTTHIKIEGLNAANTVVGTPFVDMDFTRTNTTFSLTPVTGIPTISIPTGTTIVRLKITLTDNTTGYSTLGMIVDDFSLTFVNPPAIAGVDTVCQNSPFTFTVNNLPATGITYNWDFPTGTNPSTTSTLPNPTVSWSTTGAQTVKCYLSNGTCPVDTVTWNIYVGNNPTPPTVVSPLKYCTGDNAPALTATGTNLKWYTALSGGTPSTTAPIPSTAVAGTSTWYVSQGSGVCESPRTPLNVEVHDGAKADFSYQIKYGCSEDTVEFTNLSLGGGNYQWSFGDGTGSTTSDLTHIYYSQNNFVVQLKNSGGFCKDSTTKTIDLNHPLKADFKVDKDTICQGATITFTNTSTATSGNNIDPTYFWDFGDGATETAKDPTHTFTKAGIYTVKMAVTNFVPCTDTAYRTVFIDTIPFVEFAAMDSVICAGTTINLSANFEAIGNNSIVWDFGDGNIISNINPAQHAYDTSGTFTIKFTGHYRVCPDTSYKKDIIVKPFPKVDLGRDTVMCPNAGPIMITNRAGNSFTDVSWKWNTGDSTAFIMAKEPGIYSVTGTMDGCSSSDEIEVMKDCYIDIPNSFTPNNDGGNDYFFPRQFLSKSVVMFRMQIYNRWGQIIFETTNTNGRGWDGKYNDKPQPEGVYVYVIDVAFANGVKEHYTGNVTLLR